MNAPEEKDPVWELLKKSPLPKASPLFSRNVVREARKQEAERAEKAQRWRAILSWDAIPAWLRRPANSFGAAALAAGAVAGMIALAVLPPGASFRSSETDAPAFSEVERSAAAMKEDGLLVANHLDRFDAAEEIENLEYLGQLMAVADPASLDDAALADLFF